MKINIPFSTGMMIVALAAACNSNTSGNYHGPVSDSNRTDFMHQDSNQQNQQDQGNDPDMNNPGEMYNYGDSTVNKNSTK